MKNKKLTTLFMLILLLPIFSANISVNNTQAVDSTIISNIFVPESSTTYKGTTNITAFAGPDTAYKVVMDSIKSAKTTFYLEVYTLSSEPLVNELIRAYDRGVDVVVQLSEDRVNSYEDDYTEEAAYRLDDAGISVYWIDKVAFTYTHSKFWIVDSQVAYVYSGNWAPSSIPQAPEARTNREMGLAFNDSSIAAYFENVFLDDGLYRSTPYTPGPGGGSLQANETSGTYTHPFSTANFVEYAEVTPIFSPNNSYELLSSLIQNATTTIDLELQYIKFDCDLLDDVLDAALRGVSIRVLIPEPAVANENVTETLINNGIQVKFFKGLGHCHNKYVSVDNEVVQVSSINWSNNSVVNNREAGAIVKNSNVAAFFKTVFDFDWANSETPVGFTQPVSLVSPKPGGIADGSFDFQANFAINTYTSGELYIDSTLVTTWSNPLGLESINVDTTAYSDGIHTVKVIGTPTVGSPIEIEKKVNIINTPDWLLLISEIRYDANAEPNGEFIELYNAFSFDVSIENWKLTDNEGEYIVPEGTQIDAGTILIFAQDSATYVSEMSALGITVSAADYGLGDIALANTGDEIILSDPDDNLKDAVAWGSGSVGGVTSWSGGSTGEDETLQRSPANQDTDNCNDDFKIDTPTPGTPLTPEFTTYFAISLLSVFALVTIIIRQKKRK
ncbi:MAG: phospholipase D-like domain-containing protein [Candidatus Thorarchaeota archaeon]